MSSDEFGARMDAIEAKIARVEANQELVLQQLREVGMQVGALLSQRFCQYAGDAGASK